MFIEQQVSSVLFPTISLPNAQEPDTDLPRLLRQCVLYLTVLAGYAGSFRYCRVHIHKHFHVGPDPSAAPSSLRSKAYGVFLNFTISFLKQSRHCGRHRFPCRESHGESCLLDRQLQCALARCNNLPAILLTDHRTRVDIKKTQCPLGDITKGFLSGISPLARFVV